MQASVPSIYSHTVLHAQLNLDHHKQSAPILLWHMQSAQERLPNKNLLLECSSRLARGPLKRVLNRVANSEDRKQRSVNIKPYARVVTKIAYSNSFVVVDYVIRQVGAGETRSTLRGVASTCLEAQPAVCGGCNALASHPAVCWPGLCS